MAANFLAPFSIVVLAVLLSQKLAYTPNIATGINGYGLNSVLASTEPFLTDLEAFYSYDRFTKESSTSTSSRVFKRLLLSLLLLAGDIQLNPEPNWKFPCGSCNKPVKKNQKGFQCDHCNLWYHTKCCAVGDDSYYLLANSSCTWLCVSCGLPSFSNSLFETSLDLHNSSISVTDKDKAESLNSYFHSVFAQEQLLTRNIGTSSFSSIPDLKISADGVYKQLSQLNPKKTSPIQFVPIYVCLQMTVSYTKK
ncbi:PREDICTED: uncharacterized protein LOC107342574 [Acropora digitifera]|uniref:uncharacterized protein LOC107342574 n=1 Tax=Acropora digitifera TaxID=70779 RepID=UPI00077A58E4|nr:PREDICTED: uncharacterized protein LOC107342574 [Acropora digitifera]